MCVCLIDRPRLTEIAIAIPIPLPISIPILIAIARTAVHCSGFEAERKSLFSAEKDPKEKVKQGKFSSQNARDRRRPGSGLYNYGKVKPLRVPLRIEPEGGGVNPEIS